MLLSLSMSIFCLLHTTAPALKFWWKKRSPIEHHCLEMTKDDFWVPWPHFWRQCIRKTYGGLLQAIWWNKKRPFIGATLNRVMAHSWFRMLPITVQASALINPIHQSRTQKLIKIVDGGVRKSLPAHLPFNIILRTIIRRPQWKSINAYHASFLGSTSAYS